MKKKTTLVIIFIACMCAAYSQKGVSVYIAGNFGIANAKVTGNTGTSSSKISSSIGVQTKFRLLKHLDLMLQPALAFRGYVSTNAAYKYDIKATYFDIPADIEYHFTFSDLRGEGEDLFFIGAGVYEGFCLGGKYQDKYTNDPSRKLLIGESATDNRSSTDFGLNLVAGIQSEKFRFGLQDQKGLKNVVPNARQTAGQEINLRNFSFFVAYKLKSKKK